MTCADWEARIVYGPYIPVIKNLNLEVKRLYKELSINTASKEGLGNIKKLLGMEYLGDE